MATPKTLYVDNTNDSNSHSLVELPKTIFYNIGQINAKDLDNLTTVLAEYNNSIVIQPAGKYICITTMSLDNNNKGQIILDLKDNGEEAMRIAARFEKELTQIKIKEAFLYIRNHPETHNDFKIVVGKPT